MEGGKKLKTIKNNKICNGQNSKKDSFDDKLAILDLSRMIISWIEDLKNRYFIPKDLKNNFEDLKSIIRLKFRDYLERDHYLEMILKNIE